MAQLVSIELKPLVKIRNWNRDCINPAKGVAVGNSTSLL
jgi:hypothetical protein